MDKSSKNLEELTPSDIWQQLPEDTRRLAYVLATGGGLSQSLEFIETMSQDKEVGFKLETAMEKLAAVGALEEITFIQEARELLEEMPKPREGVIGSVEERIQADLQLTDKEREYLWLHFQIEDYDEDPEQHKLWDETRYRLKPEFLQIILREPDMTS